ncbi:uncharacterized protein L201_001626 [Kwoniella dendrophila CBS 6074]|uniref:Uncharacterized protein n=1 Tax=Kwoniella dendrophila CBS 6074 TaxID=1295534 RepID=A0AAX4JPE1_9TREE
MITDTVSTTPIIVDLCAPSQPEIGQVLRLLGETYEKKSPTHAYKYGGDNCYGSQTALQVHLGPKFEYSKFRADDAPWGCEADGIKDPSSGEILSFISSHFSYTRDDDICGLSEYISECKSESWKTLSQPQRRWATIHEGEPLTNVMNNIKPNKNGTFGVSEEESDPQPKYIFLSTMAT